MRPINILAHEGFAEGEIGFSWYDFNSDHYA